MGRLFSRRKYRDLMLGLALLCAVLALVLLAPGESMAAARDGLALCGNVIIPSLFPFFVLSSLVVELGMCRYLGRLLERVMAPLFRVRGACASALALGFVGGYPVGARTAISPIRERPVLQNRGGTAAGLLQQLRSRLYPGGGGRRRSSAAAVRGCSSIWPMSPPPCCVGLLFRFYRPGGGPPAGTTCRAPVPGGQLPRGLHPFHHRGPVLHPEHLRLCAVLHGGHPDAQSLRRHGRSGRRAAAALLSPLGLDPGMGPAAAHRRCWSCPPGCPPSPERAP